MGLFGAKWLIVKVNGEKVVLTDNKSIAVVTIKDGKMEYDKRLYKLPKYALDKVQAIIDDRRRNVALRY
jgi:hypothetical protein